MPIVWNEGLWNEGLWNDNIYSSFNSYNSKMKIHVYTSGAKRLCILKEVIDCSLVEELNGEYTLSFTAEITQKLNELIDETCILGIASTFFDIVYLHKEIDEDGSCIIKVESEHISYRLNEAVYNLGVFGEYGQPSYILEKILDGTGFTVGTVEFTDTDTYAIFEVKSRRRMQMEYCAHLGGDMVYQGSSIGIVEHRGNQEPTIFRSGKNIKTISKTIDKRQKDSKGNYLSTITCIPLSLVDMTYTLGDEVLLIDSNLGISRGSQEQARNTDGELLYWVNSDKLVKSIMVTEYPVMQYVSFRIVKHTMNPYTQEVSFEISNSVNTLANSIYNIQTQAVSKDKQYNGIRIGPQYGFEAVRNDQKARAFFRSDKMAFQVGDGSGDPNMWQDKLFYEYDDQTGETKLVFSGTLSADVIEVLSSLITPNLYAGKAYISELTVDSLETSNKVQKYLNSDTSDVNYLKIYAQTIKFITARCSANFSPSLLSSGSISPSSGVATYYSGITINETTGAIRLIGGTQNQISVGEAYETGFIYRSINATSYYKYTNASNGLIYYSIYEIVEESGTSEQARTSKNELLYWVDGTYTGSTTDELDSQGNPLEPVMIYIYNELVKQTITFTYDAASGEYLPVNVLGAGSGETEIAGQGRLLKRTDGVALEYTTRTGEKTGGVYLQDDGFVDTTARRANIQIDTINNIITVSPEGDVNPIEISYADTENILYLTWPDGQVFSVSKI